MSEDGRDGAEGSDESEREHDRTDGTDTEPAADPFEELEELPEDGMDPFEELEEAPLGERTPAIDEELFEEMDATTGTDDERIVEDVLDGVATADDTTDDEVEPTEVVVPKRRYCEGCQYFSSPPEVTCEHPGTEILELVDVDHFRVSDCPVVEWRRELESRPAAGQASADPRQ